MYQSRELAARLHEPAEFSVDVTSCGGYTVQQESTRLHRPPRWSTISKLPSVRRFTAALYWNYRLLQEVFTYTS